MMTTWRRALGITTAVALSGALAGCGGGGFADESAETILTTAEQDMKALSSVRVAGDLTVDGEELDFDMRVSSAGDCSGTIGVAGGQAELMSVNGTVYMKPDETVWTTLAGPDAEMVKSAVGDRWISEPASEGGFGGLCDLDELLSDLGDDEEAGGEVGDVEDVDGTEAVTVDSETDEGDPLTVWVAVDEPHHILKMEVTEGDEPGTVTFSEFDEPLDLEPPAEDEVVDFAELGG
jgi:hypothetical protein